MGLYPGEMYGHSHLHRETVKMFAVSFIFWLHDCSRHTPLKLDSVSGIAENSLPLQNLFANWLYPDMWALLEFSHLP